MVTNIPERAKAQWNRVMEARTPEDKLRELRAFKSMVKRHKGTEKLLMQVKRKMAQLREEIEGGKGSRGTTYVSSWARPKHGAARISLVGFSRQTLSRVFTHLTGIPSLEHPLFEPIYGILDWEGVQLQTVLLPPLVKGSRMNERVFGFSKASDIILFVSAREKMGDLEGFLRISEAYDLSPVPPRGEVVIERSASGGLRVIGGVADASGEEVCDLLKGYKIRNAVVKIEGEASLEDLEKAIVGVASHVPTLAVRLLDGVMWVRDLHAYSIVDGAGSSPGDLAAHILKRLHLIRIYTKTHRGEAVGAPMLLKEGSSVGDLAGRIHSWLGRHLRYALVWRDGSEAPMRVSKRYVLKDGDIVEIRAR